MNRCRICGRYGSSHLHVFKRVLKLLGITAIFRIKRAKKKDTKPVEIIQQPIENLPLFSEGSCSTEKQS
jgi:hypothetical protein